MAIIRPAQSRTQRENAGLEFDYSKVPFVPAYDLAGLQAGAISEQEAVALACALHQLVSSDEHDTHSNWAVQARLEAVSQRK